jgi:hypothetical protein
MNMSGGNSPKTEELAYHLWERQGRPENRSSENWSEAEYLPSSWATPRKDESEGDLHMRGLGPLTQSESQSGGGNAMPSANSSETSNSSETGERASRNSLINLCVAGTALVIAFKMLFSLFRKTV